MNKWQRFRFLPFIPLGEKQQMITGSENHIRLSRKIAGEGMVLLKNENKTLPLKRGCKVALFGRGSVDYVKGGGGSGDTTVAYVRNMCQAMAEKETEGKVTVFQPLCEFYIKEFENEKSLRPRMMPGQSTEPELPQELLDAAASACDVAIISICRNSREGYDRTGEENDGDFYLSKAEQSLVEQVTKKFEKTVIVLNVGGMVDTNWFYDEAKIPAVLLAWQAGMEGACAQADILCGDVNPSGKLVDTFAKSFSDYPSSYNFHESEDYVCYTEFSMVCHNAYEADGAVHLEVEVKNIAGVLINASIFALFCKMCLTLAC